MRGIARWPLAIGSLGSGSGSRALNKLDTFFTSSYASKPPRAGEAHVGAQDIVLLSALGINTDNGELNL